MGFGWGEAGDASLIGHLRTTASHTIGVPHLAELLATVPLGSDAATYRNAVIEDNVLGRPTFEGRRRTFRHLRELYLLDDAAPAFRALRVAVSDDPAQLPLVAGSLAFTRDELLRATWPAVARARVGDRVESAELADAVVAAGVTELSPSSVAKIGRNTAACWTQTGHLAGRTVKLRRLVTAGPASVAYALTLGHLSGARGADLLRTPWFDLLDVATPDRREALAEAQRRGLVDVREVGTLLEIGVAPLTGGELR